MQLESSHGNSSRLLVSILTRPQERVQLRRSNIGAPPVRCFNPHPPTGAGATSRPRRQWLRRRCFNPHPPTGAGATFATTCPSSSSTSFNPHPPTGAGATARPPPYPPNRSRFNPHPPTGAGATSIPSSCNSRNWPVSILTRPQERVQRSEVNRSACSACVFQSSPAHRSGCNS